MPLPRLLPALLPLLAAAPAFAIPSVLPHVHSPATVHWKHPDAPALPWTDTVANQWNHNHLTNHSFEEFQRWDIDRVWDNRTLREDRDGSNRPLQFGHGLIEAASPVRFGYDSSVPAAAKPVIKAGYKAWVDAATIQFNAKRDASDRLALAFQETDDFGEISIKFLDALPGAYAQFTPGQQLQFLSTPSVLAQTSAPTKFIRKKGTAGGSTTLSYSTPWSFDGTPDLLPEIELEFSTDSGTNWQDTVPADFGQLTLIAGSSNTNTNPAPKLFVYEMDFKTIALHEIGHSIALGHTVSTIMNSGIAQNASFGSTLHTIDDDSALAVAIAYTYSIPEPTSLTTLLLLLLPLLPRRRTGSGR